MDEKISLLEKLGQARLDFQSAKVKKTGKNEYVGFDYYELHDILPKINELSKQYRFICVVSFNADTALLKVIDIDDQSQSIEFTSPMASANIKGADAIQNLGAMQTYMRRYLYMMAFEIVERDTFEGGMGKEPKDPDTTKNPEQKPNGNPSEEKQKVGKLIGEILETKNPDGQPYFRDMEIEQEREKFISGDKQAATKQLERIKKYLKERQKAYKPASYSDTPEDLY